MSTTLTPGTTVKVNTIVDATGGNTTTVDGVNPATTAATLTNHINNLSNPHQTTLNQANSQQGLCTTTGDLFYYNSTISGFVRLPIGTTNQVLNVTSGVPTWSTPSLINPTACMYTAFSTAPTVSVGTTAAALSGFSTSTTNLQQFTSPSANNLQYNGTSSITALVVVTLVYTNSLLSLLPSISFFIAVNGVTQAASKLTLPSLGIGTTTSISMNALVTINSNNSVQVYASAGSSTTITLNSMTVSIIT